MTTRPWSSVQNEKLFEKNVDSQYIDTASANDDLDNDDGLEDNDEPETNSDSEVNSEDSSESDIIATPNTLFYAMRNMLNIPDDKFTATLIADYDCSDKIDDLKGLLLSKKGLVHASHPNCDQNEHYLQFCNECFKSLEKGTKKLTHAPPAHAIANHFFVGYMPDNLFHGATWVEHAMTSLVTNVASTRIVRGGVRRAIRSHVLVFGAVPGPPVTLLPRKLEDDAKFRVILAGPFTQPQMERIKHQHLVRRDMCIGLLKFYKSNNILYIGINVDKDMLIKMPKENNPNDMFDKINELDISSDIVDLIDIQQQRVNDRSMSSNVTDNCETMMIEKVVVFIDTDADKSVLASKVANEPIFTVHASNIFDNENQIAKMFPHLFPYGRGHPNELKRRVKMSAFECCKHYLMLSSRRFAQDKYFTLAVFDRLSMANAYTRVSVRAKQKPQIYSNFDTVEVKALDEALKKRELQRRGRTGDTSTAHTTDESRKADALLKSVELSSVNVWGSNEERTRCRREAFSIVGKFGQPALFITLTPNTDNGMSIAYYSGITGLKSLHDLEFKDMPDQFHLETIAMKDYCASARLYDRTINVFLTTALGWDPVFKRSLKEGGLFGNVRAYYGMTETQGSATLHCHLLVWLYGPPMTTLQYESQSEEQKIVFNKDLELYADSIISNTLPSRPDLSSCSQCHEPCAFISLPVKSNYRLKRNSRQSRIDSKNGGLREPVLAQCKNCNSKVSAHHLIRKSLIDCRPKDWPDLSKNPTSELPVSLTPLTSIELENRYLAEYNSRVSLEEAKLYVNDREKQRGIIETNIINEQSNNFTAQTFSPSLENPMILFDELSRLSTNVKDNLINRDDIFKYYSLMPPSLDDKRLSPEYLKFIISALAAVFQGHYWQHCPSCFKFSKRTNSSNTCRYAYPKDRVETTKLVKKGIDLKRLLGHEYINSYNDVILLTFRCNHDLQILIGGVEMSDAIFYSTKYVTKRQQEVYCTVALALASFRRRIEREKADAESRQLTNDEISRKRVTGLMHTMTNSIEVAGTLAALYILRQSPCYRSHEFQSLPLDSIIKWVISVKELKTEDSVTETIELVKGLSFSKNEEISNNENSSDIDNSDSDNDTVSNSSLDLFLDKTQTRKVIYRPVRPGDDYIYRSDKFNSLTLYEFTSQVYRGKRKEGENITDQGFKEGHPLRETHVLRTRKHEAIPVIHGKKLKLLTNDSSTIDKETNSMIALVLHKPFRDAEIDLKEGNTNWFDAFKVWRPSPEINQLLLNAYDYDIARKRAGELSKEQKYECGNENTESDSDDANHVTDDDDGFNPIDFDFVTNLTTSDYSNIDVKTFEKSKKDPARFPISSISSDRTQKNLDKISGNKLFRRNVALVSDRLPQMILDQKSHLISERTRNPKELKEWVKNAKSHNFCCIADIVDDNNLNHDAAVIVTRVTELSHALMGKNCEWLGKRMQSSSPIDELPKIKKQAFVKDISYAYNLNKLQHVAFRLIAKTLIQRWLNRENYSINTKIHKIDINKIDLVDSTDQICMVLAGEGGTGKSRVITAVHALCLAWDRPHSLVKAAPTGKAAVLISGRTLASVILSLRHSENKGYSGISCLIIDEMSMMTLQDIHLLDKELRRVSGIKSLFGGISVILCGDFLQLPPAGGKPLYKKPLANIKVTNEVISEGKETVEIDYNDEEKEIMKDLEELRKQCLILNKSPNKSKSQQTPNVDEINGYEIWSEHFTNVVYLEENMRFLNDPEWGFELSKARRGIWSKRLIDIINERLLVTNQAIELNSIDIQSHLIDTVVSLPDQNNPKTMSQTVFATPSNASKQAINHIFTKAMSNSLPDDMLPIRVVADFWGQLDGLSDANKNYVMGLDESKFGRLAPFLDLVIGMSVMVTQNEEPLKGIANGTFGVLIDIQFPKDTLFRTVYDDILDFEVLVPSKLPTLAWISTNRGEGAFAPPVSGDDLLLNRNDIFPIYPCQPFRPAAPIKLLTKDENNQQMFIKNLKITQLPIIPCSASTAYKLQGETLNSEVIVDWKSEVSIINRRQQAYLMLSRCTTREALITLHLFTEGLAEWFVPDQDVLDVDDNLKRLHNELIIKEKINEEECFTKVISNDPSDKEDVIASVRIYNNHANEVLTQNNKVNVNVNCKQIRLEYDEKDIQDNIIVGNSISTGGLVDELLSKRMRTLTIIEKDIVKKSLDNNPVYRNEEIIIERYEFYYIDGYIVNLIIMYIRFNIPVTRGNMKRLNPRNWLNDEVINFTMKLLQQRDGKDMYKCAITFYLIE